MALDPTRLIKPAKKLRKLVKKMGRRPSPDAVHDLRTNSRRLEAMMEALALDSGKTAKSVLKQVGRCRKRAGKVRDLDVFTGYASSLGSETEEDCRVQLLEYLGAERRKEARKLYDELQDTGSSLRKHLKRTPRQVMKVIQSNGDALKRSKGVTNATDAATKVASGLGLPAHLSRENLHPYRLKVKELRNVLKLAAGQPPKLVDDLRNVKDAIGEWHDWEELSATAAKALDHGNCGLVAELKRTADAKYQHALSLTQQFRQKYLEQSGPVKKGRSAASPASPAEPVWDAIAQLGGTRASNRAKRTP